MPLVEKAITACHNFGKTVRNNTKFKAAIRDHISVAYGINPSRLPCPSLASDAKWKSTSACVREIIAVAPTLGAILEDTIAEQMLLPASKQTSVRSASEGILPYIAERKHFAMLFIIHDVCEGFLDIMADFEKETVEYRKVKRLYSVRPVQYYRSNSLQVRTHVRMMRENLSNVCDELRGGAVPTFLSRSQEVFRYLCFEGDTTVRDATTLLVEPESFTDNFGNVIERADEVRQHVENCARQRAYAVGQRSLRRRVLDPVFLSDEQIAEMRIPGRLLHVGKQGMQCAYKDRWFNVVSYDRTL